MKTDQIKHNYTTKIWTLPHRSKQKQTRTWSEHKITEMLRVWSELSPEKERDWCRVGVRDLSWKLRENWK